MKLHRLLSNYSLSWYRYNWKTGLLAFIAAALGVAIFSAVKLSSLRLVEGVESSEQALAFGATLQIRAAAGRIDPVIISKIWKVPGVTQIAPRINQLLLGEVRGQTETLELVGLDFFQPYLKVQSVGEKVSDRGLLLDFVKDYRAALLLSTTLPQTDTLSVLIKGQERHLALKSSADFKSLAGLPASANYLLMDIASAQDLLEDYDRIDLLDIYLKEGSNSQSVRADIQSILPVDHNIAELNEVIADQNQLTEAFRLNLEFLSAVSLPVAILTIYSVLSFLSLKRVKDLALLRVLGMTQTQIMKLLLVEALVFGVLTACFGALFGLLLAEALFNKFSMTSQALYGARPGAVYIWNPEFIVTALCTGILVSLLGFILPIQEALKGSLKTGLYAIGQIKKASYLWSIGAGVGLLLLAGLFTTRSFLSLGQAMGLLSPIFIIAGVTVLAPVFMQLVFLLIAPSGSKSATIQLALNHLKLSSSRNFVTIGALGVSFGLVLAISIFLDSFKNSVTTWIKTVTQADLYISAPSAFANKQSSVLPEGVLEWARSHPQAIDYDIVYDRNYQLSGRYFRLTALRFDILKSKKAKLLLAGRFPEFAEFSKTALISEAFQRKFNIQIGDRLPLQLSGQSLDLQVIGVLQDYTNEQGIVYLDHQTIDLSNQAPGGVSVFFKQPSDREKFAQDLLKAFPDTQLVLRSAAELRSFVLQVFDKTFGVTWILQFVALLIALLNLISIVLLMFVERTREFAILKALGAPNALIIKSICVETAILGASGALAAIAQGLLLGASLVLAINPHFFGWTIELRLDIAKVLFLAAIILVVSTLSGFVSRFLISKIDASKLRYA